MVYKLLYKMINMRNGCTYLSSLLILLITGSCFTMNYSFTGASIDPALKTASVQFIENRAQIIQPGLDQQITDELKDYIQSNTNLKLVNGIGDVDFAGEITGYTTQPAAIGSDRDSPSTETKFTITVRIQFTNIVDPELDFSSSFSRYRNYSSSQNFESVKDELTEEIVDEIVEQIYNKAFVNW